jgi:AraC-like DNA-binding protein
LITSAIVIHFKEDFWGNTFLNLPESKNIKQLLQISVRGLSIKGESRTQMGNLIKRLVEATGFERILLLCQCLQLMAAKEEYKTVSTQEVGEFNLKHKERIDKIFQYTIANFQETIKVEEVAEVVQMSVPAFCSYFKKSTKKTYIDFLNEIRVGFICKQLIDTTKTIESICYESGFNTIANFNKQFMKVKQMTPSKYRKQFAQRLIR